MYVSNGSGSGSWTTVSNDVLASAAKAFQAQLFHLQDKQNSGTDGATLTASTWNTRVINTSVTNEISSASLASNQITLPAGTYWIDAIASHYEVNSVGAITVQSHIRLRNVTAGTTTLVGIPGGAGFGSTVVDLGDAQWTMILRGRFTIGGATVFEIQDYPIGSATHLAGNSSTTGEQEVYLDACIWKIA